MDLTAVSRNIVYSQGLGTGIFLSGTGGSLEYGMISRHIIKQFGMNQPKTLAVGGKDVYLGPVHRQSVRIFMKSCALEKEDLQDKNALSLRLTERMAASKEKIRESRTKEEEQRYSGALVFQEKETGMMKKIFGLRPSGIDLFVSVKAGEIKNVWSDSVKGEIEELDGYCRIKMDSYFGNGEYGPDSVKGIYSSINGLEVN